MASTKHIDEGTRALGGIHAGKTGDADRLLLTLGMFSNRSHTFVRHQSNLRVFVPVPIEGENEQI
jgi:hypothetical protein